VQSFALFCIDFYFSATIGWGHGCPNRSISYCFCPQACKTLVTPLSFPLNMWCMRFPTSPRMYFQPVILTRHAYFLNCLFVDMPDKTWLGETTGGQARSSARTPSIPMMSCHNASHCLNDLCCSFRLASFRIVKYARARTLTESSSFFFNSLQQQLVSVVFVIITPHPIREQSIVMTIQPVYA